MPALTNIAIADGASTPVTHTYSPVTTDGQLATLKEKIGVPKGYPTLTVSCRQPVNGNGLYRVRINLQLPTTQVNASGSTTVAYTRTASIDMVIPDSTTAQERKDLRVLVANLLQNSSITSVIENPEPIW